MSDLGDRMKRHESVPQNHLSIKTPVIIRLDGKSFHTFTKQFDRPFDESLADAMISAAMQTAHRIQGFKLAFTASDEVSFYVSDFDRIESCAWFDYNVQKMASISAAYMTAYFNEILIPKSPAVFDSRVFNVPESDVPNYFLWRQMDWMKNSVSAYASKFFSHNQLQGKTTADRHELLHSIGKNWATDISSRFKNGTYFRPDNSILYVESPNYEILEDLIKQEDVDPVLDAIHDAGEFERLFGAPK
jgi:tRNA(His) 5'-end guanylyltransferase